LERQEFVHHNPLPGERSSEPHHQIWSQAVRLVTLPFVRSVLYYAVGQLAARTSRRFQPYLLAPDQKETSELIGLK